MAVPVEVMRRSNLSSAHLQGSHLRQRHGADRPPHLLLQRDSAQLLLLPLVLGSKGLSIRPFAHLGHPAHTPMGTSGGLGG